MDHPPAFDSLTDASKAEYLRRSGKLLVHELGHLYGLGHCIFNRCLMMGKGHLVEDFAAPFHLCPVCLRKMQWRLGFSVMGRYRHDLSDAFQSMGLKKETKWTTVQCELFSAPASS
jgi:archaemetzincin